MWRITNRHVIVTCASEGRAEHGTRQSEPDASPLTVEWDYYRNLTIDDFENTFELWEMFSYYSLQYDPVACDLYFYGVKRGPYA
jgi:hypothetical protein